MQVWKVSLYQNYCVYYKCKFEKCSNRRHLVLNCEGDLHIFPFDSPMCTFAIESGEYFKRQNEDRERGIPCNLCQQFSTNIWNLSQQKRFATKLISFNIWVSHLRISLQGCWKCQLGGGRISSFIVFECKTFPFFRQYSPDLISTISFHYFVLMWNVFQSFCQYLWVLISSCAQEVFFWRLGVGINQINWIVCSIEQPAMNQIFPFLRYSPFLDRSQAFLGYLLQLVSLYISFQPTPLQKQVEQKTILFQFRSQFYILYFSFVHNLIFHISVSFTILYFIFQFRSQSYVLYFSFVHP